MGRKSKKDIDFKKGKWEPEVYKGILAIKGSSRNFIVEYETEKLPYTVEYVYVPDFIISFKDGRKIYLEAKGYFDTIDRRKLVAVRKQNPDIDIRLVFQANNKIHKASPTRYSDWCEKHNFKYCIKEIPVEWLKGNE